MSFDPNKHIMCDRSFHKQLYVGVKTKYPPMYLYEVSFSASMKTQIVPY